MKFHNRWAATTLFTVALGMSSVANAALVSRLGGQAVYDTDLNVTWATNANINGLMNWAAANTWAANLVLGGVSGWRLPTTTDTGAPGCDWSYNGTDCGYNSTGSEMAHLFYNELGNLAYCDTFGNCPQPGWGLTNVGPFSNLQPDIYWSGTEYAPNTLVAWYFLFDYGVQSNVNKSDLRHALAVRPGDVAAVPIPAAAWLFGSGLLGLVGVARRRHTLSAVTQVV